MNIGDLVRVIHGTEQGRITRIINDKQVEIEIEDGFRIPVMKTEIVKVFEQESTVTFLKDNIVSDKEAFYFSFVSFNDRLVDLIFVNESAHTVFFTVYEETISFTRSLYAGKCDAMKFVTVKQWDVREFEQWPSLTVQILFNDDKKIKDPVSKRIKPKATSYFKNQKNVPVVNRIGYSIRLDQDARQISTETLTETLVNVTPEIQSTVSRPEKEVDLHIEKIYTDFSQLKSNEILKTQMELFQKNLDNAIASGMDEIIFIHGAGNGTLKNEIHKRLSQNKAVEYFKDAQKEKFGYGATLVKLK